MKIKILVIFILSILLTIVIYYLTIDKTKNILYIGETNNIINYKDYEINTFLYDNITYKELIKSIKNNDNIVIKNKKIYLNQLVNKADFIIISINNIEYNKKCKKEGYIINKYNKLINNYKIELISVIKKISSGKVIIVENNCDNNRNNIDIIKGVLEK